MSEEEITKVLANQNYILEEELSKEVNSFKADLKEIMNDGFIKCLDSRNYIFNM